MTDIESFCKRLDAPLKERQGERRTRNTLLSYSPQLVENLQYSPRQFYTTLFSNLLERQVPGLENDVITIRQSGIFSDRRLYLQLRRERLVFEICAAPFGTGFFISERLYDRRRDARWYHYVIALLLTGLLAFLCLMRFTLLNTAVIVAGAFTILWSVMRVSMLSTMQAFQDQLLDAPLIGPIYQSLFLPDTYYREDTNSCYAQAVHSAVQQTIRDILEEKGVLYEAQDGGAVTSDLLAK